VWHRGSHFQEVWNESRGLAIINRAESRNTEMFVQMHVQDRNGIAEGELPRRTKTLGGNERPVPWIIDVVFVCDGEVISGEQKYSGVWQGCSLADEESNTFECKCVTAA
jgi:hypothetical protein